MHNTEFTFPLLELENSCRSLRGCVHLCFGGDSGVIPGELNFLTVWYIMFEDFAFSVNRYNSWIANNW